MLFSQKTLATWSVGHLKRHYLRLLFVIQKSHTLFLLINILIALYLWPRSIPHWYAYPFFVQNLVHGPNHFFAESWFISVEVWFYVLFPLAVLWLMRLGHKHGKAYVSTVLCLITVGSLIRVAVVLWGHPSFMDQSRTAVFFRMDAPMYGALMAWLLTGRPAVWIARFRRWLFGVGGLTLITLSIIFMNESSDSSTFLCTVFFNIAGLAAALLLPTAILYQNRLGGPIFRLNQLLARWSYAAYLCNVPMAFLLFYFFSRQIRLNISLAYSIFLAYIFFTLCIAALCTNLIFQREQKKC